MSLFRPSSINKRSSNAQTIGVTRSAQLGISTSTCCQFYGVSCGSQCVNYTLGSQYMPTSCSCCRCCKCCTCTICTRTTDSGIYTLNDVAKYEKEDSWGNCTDNITGPQTTYFTDCGTITGSPVNCYGIMFYNAGPGQAKYFMAPPSAQVTNNYHNRSQAVTCANSVAGNAGWFVPDRGLLGLAGNCRSYWGGANAFYWSDTALGGNYAWDIYLPNPPQDNPRNRGQNHRIRAMRCSSGGD